MRAKVINLARSPERRLHMEVQLRTLRLPYDFVEAVDGRDLRLPDANLVDPSWSSQASFRAGEAGCALSHRRAYESVIAEHLDRALILEDDVTLSEDIVALAERVGQLMAGPEVVLLSFHTEQPCKLALQGSIDLPGGRRLISPVSVEQLTSAGAYVVTRDACVRMAQIGLPMCFRADQWGLWTNSHAVKRVRCVIPLAVRKDFGFLSAMDYQPPTSFHGRLQRLARSRVPLISGALALRRRAIEYRWSRLELVDAAPQSSADGNSRCATHVSGPAATSRVLDTAP